MNLPLPELFYWGSRPKTLHHHLRWQKFLQQIAIKQQRQGSPHTACCSSHLSTHSSKSQPCSWNGCQIHPLVGTEHRNSLPHTLCSRVCQGITSSQRYDSTQAPFPCSQHTLKIPQHQPPAFQVFTQVQQDTGICSTPAFPVSPKHEQGVIPPHQLRLGAEGSVQTSFPGSRGSVSTLSCGTGSSNSLRNPLQPQAVELQSRSFWPLSGSPSASEVPHLQRACSGSWAFLKQTWRFKQSLVLASLVSSAERFGLQDRSLVRAAWKMPSPVKFQLYRLVSIFGIWWLPKQDSTSC